MKNFLNLTRKYNMNAHILVESCGWAEAKNSIQVFPLGFRDLNIGTTSWCLWELELGARTQVLWNGMQVSELASYFLGPSLRWCNDALGYVYVG